MLGIDTRRSSDTVDMGVLVTAKKLGDITETYKAPLQDSMPQGNRIVDIDIFSLVFSSLACRECMNTSSKLEERSNRGICSTCAVVCADCGYERVFDISRKVRRANENNVRLVYMHRLGRGQAGVEMFSKVLKMPAPLLHSTNGKIS